MITFHFNGLSTVRGWLNGIWRSGGCIRVEGRRRDGRAKRCTQSTTWGECKRAARGDGRGGWKRNGGSVNVQAPMQHNDTAKWFDHYRANITCSTELLCRAVARNIWHRYWIGSGGRPAAFEGERIKREERNNKREYTGSRGHEKRVRGKKKVDFNENGSSQNKSPIL